MRRWMLFGCVLAACGATSVIARELKTYPRTGVQVFRGLDDTSAPTQVQDGRAQDIQNVILDSGSIQKRFGIKTIGNVLDTFGESFPAVTGVYYTKFSSGTERIIAIISSRFYFLNGSTWQQVFGGPTITAGQDNQFVFTTALDHVIATNNVDVPFQYDGTTRSAVLFTGLTNAIENAKTVAFFKNFLIFGNTTEDGTRRSTRIRWSNVGTINTWSDEDFVDIGALGGQEIVAVAELYDNLYVFLTDSIHKVSFVGGPDTFQFSKVTDDIGCIAKNSVQSITLGNAQNGLIFLDKDKTIYFFNGSIAQDISTLITTVLSGLSPTRLQYAVSVDTNTDYWLCVTSGTGTTNNLCLDLQYQDGEWTKHVNINANTMAQVIDNNSNDQVYFGSYKSFVYQLEDESTHDDVGSKTGTVSQVSRIETDTESSAQVLYSDSFNITTGQLVGAPIEIIGGTGAGQTNTIIETGTTYIAVAETFSVTPDSTSTFEVGAIDAFFTTKWYDMADASRLKHFGELYFWAEADVSSTLSIGYATDFSSDISTLSLSLSSSESDAIWGSAIWGVSLWGDVDDIFRQGKLEAQGRFIRFKFTEDDPGETFHLYGMVPVYWDGEIN